MYHLIIIIFKKQKGIIQMDRREQLASAGELNRKRDASDR